MDQARGGIEPAEVTAGIEAVKSFLSAHGSSRFVSTWDPNSNTTRIPNLAGVREMKSNGEIDYFITAEAWPEACGPGSNPRAVAKVLADRGLLLVESERHRAKLKSIPGHIKKARVYHIAPKLLQGDGPESIDDDPF